MLQGNLTQDICKSGPANKNSTFQVSTSSNCVWVLSERKKLVLISLKVVELETYINMLVAAAMSIVPE